MSQVLVAQVPDAWVLSMRKNTIGKVVGKSKSRGLNRYRVAWQHQTEENSFMDGMQTHNVVVMNHPSDPTVDLTNRFVEAITSRKAVRLLPPQAESSTLPAKKKPKPKLTVADTLIPIPEVAEEKANGDSAGVWSVKIKCKDLPGCTRHPISSVMHTQHEHATVEVSGAGDAKAHSEADPPDGDGDGDGEQKTENEPTVAGLSRLRDQVAKDHQLLCAKLREVDAVLRQARPKESAVIGDEDGWCLIRVQAKGDAKRYPSLPPPIALDHKDFYVVYPQHTELGIVWKCDVQRNSRPAHAEEEDLSFALDPAKNDLEKADVGAVDGGDVARQLLALGSYMGTKRVHASGGLLVRGAIDFNVVLDPVFRAINDATNRIEMAVARKAFALMLQDADRGEGAGTTIALTAAKEMIERAAWKVPEDRLAEAPQKLSEPDFVKLVVNTTGRNKCWAVSVESPNLIVQQELFVKNERKIALESADDGFEWTESLRLRRVTLSQKPEEGDFYSVTLSKVTECVQRVLENHGVSGDRHRWTREHRVLDTNRIARRLNMDNRLLVQQKVSNRFEVLFGNENNVFRGRATFELENSVKSIEDNTPFANTEATAFYFTLVLSAAVMAAIGLAVDSVVVIVASMLVSPLMAPIQSSAIAIATRQWRFLKLGIASELLGMIVCMLVGFISAILILTFDLTRKTDRLSKSWPNYEMESRGGVEGLGFGFFVAFVSAVAVCAAVYNPSKGTSSVIGVAISASLLPPLVNGGFLTGFALWAFLCSDWNHVDSLDTLKDGVVSVMLAVINIVTIFVVLAVVFCGIDFRLGGERGKFSFKNWSKLMHSNKRLNQPGPEDTATKYHRTRNVSRAHPMHGNNKRSHLLSLYKSYNGLPGDDSVQVDSEGIEMGEVPTDAKLQEMAINNPEYVAPLLDMANLDKQPGNSHQVYDELRVLGVGKVLGSLRVMNMVAFGFYSDRSLLSTESYTS